MLNEKITKNKPLKTKLMKHLIPKSYLENNIDHPTRSFEKKVKAILKGGVTKEKIAEIQKLTNINLDNYRIENGKVICIHPEKVDKFNAIIKKHEERMAL